MAQALELIFAAMEIQNYKPGSAFAAVATHLVDPHNFYVLPVNCRDIVNDLQVPGGQLTETELKENELVVYFSQAVNRYVRGSILEVIDAKCTIFAIDNGFTEKDIMIKRIFHPAKKNALLTPALARHCELDQCEPLHLNFSQDAIDAFKYFIGNERLHMTIRGVNGNKLRVAIYNSNPADVATLLALTQYTHRSAPYQCLEYDLPIPTFQWKHQEIFLGHTINLRIQHGSSLNVFYGCTPADYEDYLRTRNDFTRYCRSQNQIQPADFRRGKPIGVMENYGEPYERAIIQDVIEEGFKARVKLIDWGREFVAEVDKIKAVKTPKFAATAVRAIFCSSPNGRAWDNGHHNFMAKGFVIAVTFHKIGRDFDIPHIVTIAPVYEK